MHMPKIIICRAASTTASGYPPLAPRAIGDGGPGNPPVDAVTPPLPKPLPFHSTQAPSTVGHLAGPEGGEDEEDERWLEAGAELQLADDAGTMAPGWTSAMQRKARQLALRLVQIV